MPRPICSSGESPATAHASFDPARPEFPRAAGSISAMQWLQSTTCYGTRVGDLRPTAAGCRLFWCLVVMARERSHTSASAHAHRFQLNRRRHDAIGGESGQTIVLLAVMLVALLGMAGLAIDYGNWMVNKRQLQNAADAAALAGAAKIPAGNVAANAAARSEYASNGQPGDSVTVTQSSDLTSNDSVTVTATRTIGTWFTGVLGIHSVTETVSARATIESYTQLEGTGAMPWGVLQGTYVPGQPYSI